jgi:hypothetical protein
VLAVGGIRTLAVMVFFLIVPLFVAAVVSALAVTLAKRQRSTR